MQPPHPHPTHIKPQTQMFGMELPMMCLYSIFFMFLYWVLHLSQQVLCSIRVESMSGVAVSNVHLSHYLSLLVCRGAYRTGSAGYLGFCRTGISRDNLPGVCVPPGADCSDWFLKQGEVERDEGRAQGVILPFSLFLSVSRCLLSFYHPSASCFK